MSELPRIILHGGKPVADGLELPVPRLAQGIIVYDTLYLPPDPPEPYYPHWYAQSLGEGEAPGLTVMSAAAEDWGHEDCFICEEVRRRDEDA